MKRLILLAHIFLAPLLLADPLPQTRTAVFAGGCFWCIQPAFDKAPGVIKTVVGYCGGTEPNPTYALVGSEKTNYRESIQVTYDPAKINFDQLLIFTGGRSIRRNPTASSPILDRVIAPPSLCRTTKSERSRKHQR